MALELVPERLQWLQGITATYPDLLDIAAVGGNGLSLPFKGATFNTIICNSVLEHIEDDHKVIKEIARVLVDHGVLLITVPNIECRFGYHASSFWRLVWRMPTFLKSAIGNSTLLNSGSPPEAAEAIDAWYQHRHLYTPDDISEMLKPSFMVVGVRPYMRCIGGFAHDLTLIFKPFVKRAIIAVLPMLIRMDSRISCGSPGKGFAIIAVRVARTVDD